MIILCSPTKTMRKTSQPGISQPLFPAMVSHLQHLMVDAGVELIQKSLKINDKLAKECYENFVEFKADRLALEAFNGLQFKQLALESLNDAQRNYAYEHVHILSGLYGILRASDNIAPYRLDYENVIAKQKIIDFHRENVNAYLQAKDQVIIDLCSQEYSQILEVEHIRIDFLEANLKSKATNSKIQRGKMLRYCIEKMIMDPNELQNYQEDDYHYRQDISTKDHWIFVKGGKNDESK
ncbi:MAG: YaaA family protein [Erysipelotrichaceae bacterium]|nr:YaaA family protein [Erysipelotrichaceae bacterium]MDY5251539.1 YaaA family protein [Erysipelotrichaceae bacterium]